MSISSPVLIIGAGGHAKVIIELFRAAGNFEIVGLIDLDSNGYPVLGIPVIGTDRDLVRFRRQGISRAFVGIGNNVRRVKLNHHLHQIGFDMLNAVSPAAVVSVSSTLGRGIAIMAGAVINAETRIDDSTIVNTNSCIDHDCRIAEGAHIAPGCSIAGNVRIGRLACIGAGTTIIPGISVGENALVGAGSCVTRDVPDFARAWGVPARIKIDYERDG
jgi:UDP-perosamine 4-acetyltransferase